MTEPDAPGVSLRSIDRSSHLVLVVNDDPAGRYATVRQLASAGFSTAEAASGEEALRLASGKLSAVILDIHLPDIDGLEVCRRLRADSSTRAVPVVHLTAAYLSDHDKVRGLDAGADAYLTHPVEPAVLVSTVQALIRARSAEEGMRRSEARFRAVYSRAPVGVCLLSVEGGRVLDANPALLQLLRRDRSLVLGRPLEELVAPSMRDAFVGLLAHRGAEEARAEVTMLDPDGEEVPVEWSVVPNIEPGVCLAMSVDLTPRIELARQRQQLLDRERDARTEAERTSRTKDDLIAVLSHELRTPLNAIMGWTHVLQRTATPETLARGLEAITRNVGVQARLISDILDMSRLNIGKLPLRLEEIDVQRTIDAVVGGVQSALTQKSQRLIVDFQPLGGALLADEARLQQILWNLVGNASKFSPDGSEIRLDVGPQDDGVRIAVADRGQGISPDFLSHVFDRFAQDDVSSNRRHGGLGLGLAIVKNLVEAHDGRVSARSDGAGLGATFEVWLPYSHGPTLPAESIDSSFGSLVQPTEGQRLKGVRMLLVDDDVDAGNMLALVVGEQGALPTVARHFETAVQAFSSQVFDVLIGDIGMPGRDGHELMRELRRIEGARGDGRHIVAVALTAFARDTDKVQALESGFDAHLGKPLRPHRLLQLLEGLLTHGAASSAKAP